MANYHYPDDLFGASETATKLYPGFITFRSKSFNDSKSSFKKSSVIQMPMPKQLAANYEHNWDSAQLGSITGEMIKNISNINNVKDLIDGAGAVGSMILQKGKDTLLGEGGSAVIALKSGQATNNKVALTYKGENIRNFDFNFEFAPKNQNEAIACLNIINEFKKRSFTKTDLNVDVNKPKFGSNATISFPDAWQITFNTFNKANQNLFVPFKIGTCACTKVNVNYSPDDNWSTFDNGIPTHMTLGVSFQELHPISNTGTNAFPDSISPSHLNKTGF